MYNEEDGKFESVSQTSQNGGTLTESTATSPEYGRVQIFLHIPRAYEQGGYVCRVATSSRLLKILGLFCTMSSLL